MDLFIGVLAVGLLAYWGFLTVRAGRAAPPEAPAHGPLDEHDYRPVLQWADEGETIVETVLVCDCGRTLGA